MEHLETIQRIKRYFDISELAGKDCAKKYGEFAWAFFDSRLLEVLLWLREGLGVPLVCNTKALQQRGLRTNLSAIVKEKTDAGKIYMSAHCLGKGVDLSSGKMTADAMRVWVRQHIDECPYPIRMEKDVTWLHVDVLTTGENGKLIEFKG